MELRQNSHTIQLAEILLEVAYTFIILILCLFYVFVYLFVITFFVALFIMIFTITIQESPY